MSAGGSGCAAMRPYALAPRTANRRRAGVSGPCRTPTLEADVECRGPPHRAAPAWRARVRPFRRQRVAGAAPGQEAAAARPAPWGVAAAGLGGPGESGRVPVSLAECVTATPTVIPARSGRPSSWPTSGHRDSGHSPLPGGQAPSSASAAGCGAPPDGAAIGSGRVSACGGPSRGRENDPGDTPYAGSWRRLPPRPAGSGSERQGLAAPPSPPMG